MQEKQPNNGNLKALWDAHNALKKENGYGHPPAIWIDWVELEGPLPKVEIAESKIHRVEPETTINPKNEKAIKGMEDRRFLLVLVFLVFGRRRRHCYVGHG